MDLVHAALDVASRRILCSLPMLPRLLLSVVLWLARLWPIEMSKEDAGELLQTAVDEPHAHR